MNAFRIRSLSCVVVLTCCFLGIISRLFYIQIVKGKEYAVQCRKQSTQRVLIDARRGTIRDRNGYVLAQSITADEYTEKGKKTAYDIPFVKRVYPHGTLAGAVIGYVGKDGDGLSGIEYSFNNYLKGENGWRIIQKDGINRKYTKIGMPEKEPVAGHDVYLTINIHIQKIVEKVLKQTVDEYSAHGGMAIAMDPVTGDILAMANEPGFDPNNWKGYPLQQRRNACISYNYEPGSTFKVVTAATALENNVKKESDTVNGNRGIYTIYNQTIRDHKPYGWLTFSEALSYSSNVCFAKIAEEIGSQRLYKFVCDFGLGTETGIFLPGEEIGIVHPIQSWSGRSLVTMAMGHEISATLLQMMVVFATVANGGILVEPHIYRNIVAVDGEMVKSQEVKVKRRVISDSTALRLRRMMKGVVDFGTGRRGAIADIAIAGKTGTSQKIDAETGTYSRDHVWSSFIGFVPVESPRILCGIVIDQPLDGEEGGIVAAPAFRSVIQQIISHPNLEYAEKILKIETVDKNSVYSKSTTPTLPDVCGMQRQEAVQLLNRDSIPFEILGSGALVCFQNPAPGKRVARNAKLMLYTREAKNQDPDNRGKSVSVPDCIGKDCRDAINIMNIKGLVPYVQGNGMVMEQIPIGGSMIHHTVQCTLICSFEG